MDLEAALAAQERAWHERPLLRRVYSDWYRTMLARMSPVAGRSIELGSGIGRLREIAGDRIVLTDIEKTRWVDERVDALALPDRDASVANILMLDVLHHLADPAAFLDEAVRVLAPGGRVVMVEPYCSPLSAFFYKRFHHERTDLSADPFASDATTAAGPMESNQARPTLIFFRHGDEFRRRWPELELAEERRFAFLLYPLTGGFSRRPLVPSWLGGALSALDRGLSPFGPLLAFRCLVVLERRMELPR
jgi:SAM-dependent methyltransferase